MRKPILNTYIETFGCNIDEAYIEDLTQYKNLGEFFRRSLKPGVRPIDSANGIVSQKIVENLFIENLFIENMSRYL